MSISKTYSAKDIEVLEGLAPVRKRPGMYIGGTDENAYHHLVNEILDNSIDEAVAGYSKEIKRQINQSKYNTNFRWWKGYSYRQTSKEKQNSFRSGNDNASLGWKI